MNLIELKSAWTILQQDIIINDKVDQSKILDSVHGKSKSEITNIKSGLQLKFIIATTAIIGAIGLATTSIIDSSLNPLDFIFSPIESVIFFLVMALSISVMVYFNYLAYRKISLIQQSSLNLKDNLHVFIDAMHKAINFNIYSDAIMTPIIFTWVYYAYAFNDNQFGLNVNTTLLLGLPILVGLFSYNFQRFMQRLKFGRYLDRLIRYLDALQNKSSEL